VTTKKTASRYKSTFFAAVFYAEARKKSRLHHVTTKKTASRYKSFFFGNPQ